MMLNPNEEWFIICGENRVYEDFLAKQGVGKYAPKWLWMGPGPGVENWRRRMVKRTREQYRFLVLNKNWFTPEDIEELQSKIINCDGIFFNES